MTDGAGSSLEGILETALYASDLDAAEAFYAGVLGLAVITRVKNRHVFFSLGRSMLLVFNPDETVKPAPAGALPVPAHGAKGPGHACFRVSAERIDTVRDALEVAGTPIEADFRWPNGARSLYFRDPAGNSLECAEGALWQME